MLKESTFFGTFIDTLSFNLLRYFVIHFWGHSDAVVQNFPELSE